MTSIPVRRTLGAVLTLVLAVPPAAGCALVSTAVGAPAGDTSRGIEPADSVERAARPWVWPTGSRQVLRGWEQPADDYSAGHRGLDVAAPIGTTAVAVADGTVTFAGQVGGRGVVSIDHGGGLVSTLDSVVPAVAAGSQVTRGEAVGTVAAGHCTASEACLHLGARLQDRYVDPLPYLPAADWPVLLPESAWPG